MTDGLTEGLAQAHGVRPAGRTVALWAIGLIAGFAITSTAFAGLRRTAEPADRLAGHSVPATAALLEAAKAATDGQAAFIEAMEATDATERAAAITRAELAGRVQEASWTRYLAHAGTSPAELALQGSYQTASARSRELAAGLLTMAPDDPRHAEQLRDERRESSAQVLALTELVSGIHAPSVDADVEEIDAGLDGTAQAILLVGAGGALVFCVAGAVLLRGARRDQRLFQREARALRLANEEAELEGSVQRGLELTSNEPDAYEIVAQALEMAAPSVSAELLVADSSRAHFQRAVATAAGQDTGCPVGHPGDCPAARSAQTREFSDSTQIDTCRHLRGREVPVWATCIPVSISGLATGVIHVEGPLPRRTPDRLLPRLELVARKTGERLSALRVLARTTREAQVDPLTGLDNRRTLEQRARELRVVDGPYVVAFADLDHFKSINDSHGHDTGDRALRLFARALRDSLRPGDLVSRYGGEEFVAVLPDCSLPDARRVAERVRTRLAAALDGGTVPPFTVTIGLAPASPGQSLEVTIAEADATMLEAKAAGRDRVLVAGESPPPPGRGAVSLAG